MDGSRSGSRVFREYVSRDDVRRDTRTLKAKAVASLRRAAQAFNGLDDDGRHTSDLLHLQHAFEMLLKAGLR